MQVTLKNKYKKKYDDLSYGQIYYVIGIEADDFRVKNNDGKPYLFPSKIFSIVDNKKPDFWFSRLKDSQLYAYPREFMRIGFFEDYFNNKEDTINTFNRVMKEKYLYV